MAKKAQKTAPKRRGRKPKIADTIADTLAGKVNGSGDDEPKMVVASDDLGPIVLPSPEDSQRVLDELAKMQHQRYAANHRYEYLKERAKEAKAKVESLDEQISERIRVATHESDLPLFQPEQAEADLSRIQAEATAERVEPVEGAPVPPLALPEAAPMSEEPF